MNKFKELLDKAGNFKFIEKVKGYIILHKIAAATTAGIAGVAIVAGVVTAVTLGHNSGREIAVGGETAKEENEAIVMYHSDDDSYYDYEDFDPEAEEALLALPIYLTDFTVVTTFLTDIGRNSLLAALKNTLLTSLSR